METLIEQNVPHFVKGSLYLQTLLSNGPFPESGIDVPAGCAKNDLTITSATDLAELLKTLRFWMVPEVLESCTEFLVFAFNVENELALQEYAAEFESTIPFVAAVAHMVYMLPHPKDRVTYATFNGYIHLLRYMREELGYSLDGAPLVAAKADQVECLEYILAILSCYTVFPRYVLAEAAAHSGSLRCLQYLVNRGLWLEATNLYAAASGGSLACLQCIIEADCPGLDTYFDRILLHASKAGHLCIVEYLWREHSNLRTSHSQRHVVLPAAESGHLSILQFAHAQGFAYFATPTSAIELFTVAAEGGFLPCLEFLFSVGQQPNEDCIDKSLEKRHFPCVALLLQHGCPVSEYLEVDEEVIYTATTLEEIKGLLELGLPCDESTMMAVAKFGNIDDIKYLRVRGCPWNGHTSGYAARYGHLECLKYVMENGCPWPDAAAITNEAAWSASLDCLKYVMARGGKLTCDTAVNAAAKGSVEMLRYILSLGCPVDARAATAAVRTTSGLECLRLLLQHKCPPDASIYESIAGFTKVNADYMDCVKLAHERGCPWNAEVCLKVTGCFEILRYMHQNSCPLHPDTCRKAANLGNVDSLRYAHENGCPWDVWVCIGATLVNDAAHLACLRFAHENGCPWDEQTCSAAAARGSLLCLQYAHEQGCPWDKETCIRATSRACYQYAAAHGCPGAELSRFYSSAMDCDDADADEEEWGDECSVDEDEELDYDRYLQEET